jgi:glycosyltransferase involved in cell wall biosynthesis
MAEKKIKVLVAPDDNGGVFYWRMEQPHLKLDKLYGDEFDVVINHQVNWRDFEYLKQFDLVVFHKGLFPDYEGFHEGLKFCKDNNITTVMDIDDYWDLGQFHPQSLHNKVTKGPERTCDNIRLADYVTTTTPLFANDIKKFNKNVMVFPNAVNTDEPQWAPDFSKTDKLRIGYIMGSTHERDMELVRGLTNQLYGAGLLSKVQIVLCGYDIRGNVTIIGPDKTIQGQRPIKPEESVWYRYEQMVTDGYRICSPEYKEFLEKFIPNLQYPNVENETYRREWTKNLTSFGTHYNNLDVLLVPLDENAFNYHKSELKLAEAGTKHKAVIASEYGPYTVGTRQFLNGGNIDPEGNCILIEKRKAHKAWFKAIKTLLEHPEYVTMLQDNLAKHIEENYNLEKWTAKRAEWYKQIIQK